MIDRFTLLDRLSIAVDKAAKLVSQHTSTVNNKKTNITVGNVNVIKHKDTYSIMSNKTELYKDIPVVDVAIMIAQRHNNKEFKTVDKLLLLVNTFSRYYAEMLTYLHCMKIAKSRNDYIRMAILEDKFHMSEIRAKKTRNEIFIYEYSPLKSLVV